jgi:ABC-type transport system involved in multi-copper enzyme maturation permease subunit
VRVNPVLEREVRERPRTVSSVVMLTFFLAVLVAIAATVYEAERYAAGSDEVVPTSLARIGQGQFEWVLFFMLLLVLFLVPGYTASSIAGERERQTLLPVQLTLLRPSRIVSGKAAASVAFLALLVVASAPLLGLSFAIGGISLVQVVRGLAAVLFVGLVVAFVTVTCSTLVRRTASATVLAYTVVLALLVGPVMLWGGVTGLMRLREAGPDNEFAPQQLAALNPVMFVSAAIDTTDPAQVRGPMFSEAATPFAGVRQSMHPAPRMNLPAGQVMDVFGGFLWWSLLFQVAFAGLCWWVASRRLRTPAERER